MTRILYIEDNRTNQILLERVLTPHGFEIRHAADGETGIEMALEFQPDLILVDLGLPDLDGQTVGTLLKQMPTLQGVPIVAITAWPAEKARETAERYGLDGCLMKPIDVKSFPEEIAQFFKREV
jgi:two-component system cell cycle response regulator DivK